MIQIRDASEENYKEIIRLNESEVEKTSSMDKSQLASLNDMSSFHKVAVIDNNIVGFLLTIREGEAYENKNYSWFSKRYERFIYIDRVVVSKEFTDRKIGSKLYGLLFGYAADTGSNILACEYNIDPPNDASKVFHQRMGFREVGIQRVANGSKLVSMQIAEA